MPSALVKPSYRSFVWPSNRWRLPDSSAGLGFDLLRHRRCFQVEELDHVASQDRVRLLPGYTRKHPIRISAGLRPVALDVREIGGKHQVVNANLVAHLNRGAFHMLHAEHDVVADVLAGHALWGLEAEQPLVPAQVFVVPVICHL